MVDTCQYVFVKTHIALWMGWLVLLAYARTRLLYEEAPFSLIPFSLFFSGNGKKGNTKA